MPVARRRRDSALLANIEHMTRWRGACASDAQGEPPTEAGAHSPTGDRRRYRARSRGSVKPQMSRAVASTDVARPMSRRRASWEARPAR